MTRPLIGVVIGVGFTIALTLLLRTLMGAAAILVALPIGLFMGYLYARRR